MAHFCIAPTTVHHGQAFPKPVVLMDIASECLEIKSITVSLVKADLVPPASGQLFGNLEPKSFNPEVVQGMVFAIWGEGEVAAGLPPGTQFRLMATLCSVDDTDYTATLQRYIYSDLITVVGLDEAASSAFSTLVIASAKG
ncbi:hypothetical protein HD806DRAFT_523177 [Xylariaceae sp. AK1471]|nr:hypothetical protein HD806DRAFT_523177 [Xylariaceae sp. AK1471]